MAHRRSLAGSSMKIIIHRGTKEIGGSCVEVATATTRVIVDLGMPLVAPWDKKEKLDSSGFSRKSSKDLLEMGILPPAKGLYAMDGDGASVDAVVLSHPHMDHYGLLGHIRPEIPVYLSDGAKRIIAASDIFLPLKANIKRPVIIEDRKPVKIGDIKVTPYLVDHSGFGAMSFLIEADGKKVFYTGDFRAHGRKAALFPKFLRTAPQGVDCLLLEGTTLGRPPQRMETEEEIGQKIIKIARAKKGLKLMYASGQNIDRLVSFYKAAISIKGFLVLDLYTAYVLESLGYSSIPHPSKSYPAVKVLYSKYLMRKIAASKMSDLFRHYRPFEIKAAEIGRDPGRYFLIYRESLKEEVEAVGNFKDAVMIYSMYEGYRHEPSFQKVQAFLTKHDIALEVAHTSGHAGSEDLKKLVDALKPKVVTPIHTFEPGRYGELWGSIHPLDDGGVFEIP